MSQIAVALRPTLKSALVLAVTLAVAACAGAVPPSTATVTSSAPSAAPSAVETTAPATPSSAPSASTPLPTTWQPVDLFPTADGPFDPGLAMSDTGGFIVVARAHDIPSVWSSPDGERWTNEALAAVGQSKASPYTGAVGVNRTVLLGVGDGQCAHPVADFTWARPAGGAWAAAPWQDLFCAGGQGSIATDGQTFVVAGTGAGDQPFLWSSQDGLTWTTTPMTADLAPVAVVWTGSELLVLARSQAGFVALTSPNGTDWSSAPASGLPNGGLPRLFVLSGRTVALVPAADRSLVAYERQANGSWQAAATVAAGLHASADDVTTTTSTTGLGFVFLSTTTIGATVNGATVLASADGFAWHLVPAPKASRFIGAAVFGDRAVLIGATDAATGTQALAWWGPATLLRGG